jgi:hypothetical protein
MNPSQFTFKKPKGVRMKPAFKEIFEEYERGMRGVLWNLREKHKLTCEQTDEVESSFKKDPKYDEDNTHFLYLTIMSLDSSFSSSADIWRNCWEYEDSMDECGAWTKD